MKKEDIIIKKDASLDYVLVRDYYRMPFGYRDYLLAMDELRKVSGEGDKVVSRESRKWVVRHIQK